jgi:hypothetical protein
MRSIGTYAGVVVLLIVAVLSTSAAFTGATQVYTETDNVTVDYTSEHPTVTSQAAASFLDNETVTNETGETLVEGVDYDWNTTTGNVTFNDTSKTSVGETVTVDFAYNGYSDETIASRDVLGLAFRIGAILTLVGAAVVIGKWTSFITGGGR